MKAGKLCGTIAGLPWPQETRGEGKRSGGGGGGRPEASAGMRGRAGVAMQGGFYATVVGEEFSGELL